MSSVLSVALPVVAGAIPGIISNYQSSAAIGQSEEQKQLALKSLQLSKESFYLSTIGDIEMALVQTDTDLMSAMKEAERDSHDQKNAQLQTLIISTSVMIASIVTLIVQGYLPEEADKTASIFFGLFNGLSFALLFVSLGAYDVSMKWIRG